MGYIHLMNQVCERCVMDTSDTAITFDDNGICGHCKNAYELNKSIQHNLKNYSFELVIQNIKNNNSDSKYDGIIGLSGGLDSSYVALKVVEAGLRPLVVHVDGGWNSDIAVRNVRSIVETLGLSLVTKVINWSEMRDLQIAYLKSGIANQDVPQDHAFFSMLYKVAAEHKISTVITGSNIATESVLPKSWEYDAMDGRHVKSIAKEFHTKLNDFPVLTLPRYYGEHVLLRRMKVIRPLNHLEYVRDDAINELGQKIGWKDYGGKHRESLFTDWFQHSYLLRRLGIDKRKAHLSSLVMSNQISRDQALREIAENPLSVQEEKRLTEFVCRKLGVSGNDLQNWIIQPERSYNDFRNDEKLIKYLSSLKVITRLRRVVGA